MNFPATSSMFYPFFIINFYLWSSDKYTSITRSCSGIDRFGLTNGSILGYVGFPLFWILLIGVADGSTEDEGVFSIELKFVYIDIY